MMDTAGQPSGGYGRGPGLCIVAELSAHRAMVVRDVSSDNHRRT